MSTTRMNSPGSGGEWIKYVFGAVGAIIGFVVGNWDKLLDIVLGTSITVTTGSDLGKLDSSWTRAVTKKDSSLLQIRKAAI